MSKQSGDGPTREAFEALMTFLGTGGDPAAEYFALRQRLVKVLEIRAARYHLRAAPEDLADEAIERVATQLLQGLEIQASDPFRYFRGVAGHVVQEAQRAEAKAGKRLDDNLTEAPVDDPSVARQERRLRCLDACLAELPRRDRQLILRFYRVGRGTKRIAVRKRLAKSLGLTPNALRIKAFRLRRQRIEPCLDRCLERAEDEP